jgi:hypothetical protein
MITICSQRQCGPSCGRSITNVLRRYSNLQDRRAFKINFRAGLRWAVCLAVSVSRSHHDIVTFYCTHTAHIPNPFICPFRLSEGRRLPWRAGLHASMADGPQATDHVLADGATCRMGWTAPSVRGGSIALAAGTSCSGQWIFRPDEPVSTRETRWCFESAGVVDKPRSGLTSFGSLTFLGVIMTGR